MALTRLDESDEEEIATVQTSARQFSFTEYPPIPVVEPLGPQVCIACGSCEKCVATLSSSETQLSRFASGSMMAG